MKKLSISQLKTAIKEIVVRLDKPILVRGGFGIGKSQAVEQAVDELDSPKALQALLGKDCPYTGAILVDIRLSQYDSVDLRGFPQADKKTGTAIWYPPSTFPFIPHLPQALHRRVCGARLVPCNSEGRDVVRRGCVSRFREALPRGLYVQLKEAAA